ncbi:GCN5-related N-acetyltransferase [Rippkaea orientalis PCC 8801]|uniref:GCN5-related N-acetyltransferase n=1 Tax=Rippkaea orientalis (strain PCC 8801 / RF-1) TaxID=41431 RepID=B7JZC2_RIPO1|nr:N-acetyltransferase [Rippkaea orientalis]ACK67333.1 GCN5-related N-acetyltransferase [Rippkaea orientalis PCC 8801]
MISSYNLSFRAEQPSDRLGIRQIHQAAFGSNTEANIVGDLIERNCPRLSLVAVLDNQAIAHILFTPAIIETRDRLIEGMGLAPLAVLPEFQRQGIGSHLTTLGLETLKNRGEAFVIVLGDPDFYSRFGFIAASSYGIISEFDNIPDEAFRIRIFNQELLNSILGVAKYQPEFSSAI